VSIPFEVLVEYAASLTDDDMGEGLAQLAARAGTFPERLADALVAVKLVRLNPAELRAVMHPSVRKVLDADRGGVASGVLTSGFGREEFPSELA
jgi:hypothetical protein